MNGGFPTDGAPMTEVEKQLRQLREFAASQGWTVYHEFTDHETAKTDDRAECQAMVRDARQRKFDVLLFWTLDRNVLTCKRREILRSSES